MAWDWKEYRQFAERLRTEATEVSQRNAISRGYYAAFGCTRRYLLDVHEIRVSDRDCHSEIRRQLDGLGGTHLAISSNLSTMCTARVRADYEPDVAHIERKVNEVLSAADAVLHLLDKLQAQAQEQA